ncbi:MAG: hypothetical protein P1V81_08480 [Planctomycetota bacterium]|nr:hypothetical protein [Planctomycetota bacterium]
MQRQVEGHEHCEVPSGQDDVPHDDGLGARPESDPRPDRAIALGTLEVGMALHLASHLEADRNPAGS